MKICWRSFWHETRVLIFLAVYLTLFLNALHLYRSLILGQGSVSFYHVGYNIVMAVVLAKIILLGRMLKLGEKYSDLPLIVPALYKAAIFTIFVLGFTLLEHFVFGMIEGKGWEGVWQEFASKQNLGKVLITFLVFILLFSFLQLSRVIGEEKFFNLFFTRKKS